MGVHNPEDTEWMQHGICHGTGATDLWFPVGSLGVDEAKARCNGCPVQTPCLEYALHHRIDHGVWGGQSEIDRSRIRRGRLRHGHPHAATG